MKLSYVMIDNYQISLTKMCGPIKDVLGYITSSFGEPIFQLTRIEFVDGSNLWCEGEHDMPYLTSGSSPPPGYDDDTLQALYDEGEVRDET